jgi:hypothetical protein
MQRILEDEFPGNKIMVHVFGSSGNMLWTSESDGRTAYTRQRNAQANVCAVDICIQTPMKRLEEMHPLAEALDKRPLLYIPS